MIGIEIDFCVKIFITVSSLIKTERQKWGEFIIIKIIDDLVNICTYKVTYSA